MTGQVYILSGDAASRGRIASTLQEAGYTCRELTSGEETLRAAREEEPLAIVLAVVLPGMSGYDVCGELRREHGDLLPIIFYSQLRTDSLDRVAGLLLGADEYIVDPFAPEEFVARVRRAVTRTESLRAVQPPSTHGLTRRESEVLKSLANGLSQQAIATELVISPKTVASHIQRILSKLGVHSRAEAVAYAFRAGMLDGKADSSTRLTAVSHGADVLDAPG